MGSPEEQPPSPFSSASTSHAAYELIGQLAEGGMGVVELVRRREGRFERLYARKRLYPQARRDPAFRAMFMDEARLTGLLRHANVVSVLDVGEDDDGPFLIMDYVEGVPLLALLRHGQEQQRLLPLQICVRIVAEAARGLHAAHEARGPDGQELGLVHRDVSMGNILVGFDGAVRVADFGIAKALGNATRTTVGVLKGNRAYVSPEQLRFRPLDRRSDLFSLGVVLHELLSGEHLYGGDAEQAGRRILDEPPPDIAQVRTDVPTDLGELIFELLAKEPEARPATAGEVAARLDRIAAQLAADEDEVLDVAGFMAVDFADTRATKELELAQMLTAPPPPVPTAAATRVERPAPRRRAIALAGGALAMVLALGAAVALLNKGDGVAKQAVVAPGPPLAVFAGGWHTCATEGEALWCWGKNGDGQLGDSSTTDRVIPMEVKSLRGARTLALGSFHTCACTRLGQAHCWGRNEEGQLGTGSSQGSLTPARVRGLPGCDAIAAGSHHTCALHRGRVWCWGTNAHGQLGPAVADHQLTPQPLPELGEVTALALGHDTTCALRSDGTVWCLGDDRHGQLGRGTSGSHSTQAAQIPGLEGVVQVAAGAANACARLRSGRVMCWGRRGDDKVDVPYGNLLVPTHVPGIEGAIDLAVGSTHLCVRRPGGRLDCAGSNFFGQLGDGTRQTFRELAVSTVDIGQVTGVAAANIHTCAVHAHGVSCWGGNFTGQLGDGTLRERPRPVSVAQLSR